MKGYKRFQIDQASNRCINPFKSKLCQGQFSFFFSRSAKVLIFCVELWELSHLTRDIFQAEKKINVVTSQTNAQNDIYIIQNTV